MRCPLRHAARAYFYFFSYVFVDCENINLCLTKLVLIGRAIWNCLELAEEFFFSLSLSERTECSSHFCAFKIENDSAFIVAVSAHWKIREFSSLHTYIRINKVFIKIGLRYPYSIHDCQMAYFHTRNDNFGILWKALIWTMLVYIFHCHLVLLLSIWYIYFSPFMFIVPRKIWQRRFNTRRPLMVECMWGW
jgi:hypothetical protein